MVLKKLKPGAADGIHRRRIVVPKGFPDGREIRTLGSRTGRSFRSRISGPAGAFALHGALLLLLFHFQMMREAFGERDDDLKEWVWLPEVAIAALPQEPPPPPPPLPEPVATPEIQKPPEPVPENAPDIVPDPPESIPQPEKVVPPQLKPVPEPPSMIVETAPLGKPDAWLEVRTNIIAALRYPTQARRKGMAGIVHLSLRVDGAGHIVYMEIKPPEPPKPLGDAVRTAVRRAAPFPALGEAIRQGQTPDMAELPIRFELHTSEP